MIVSIQGIIKYKKTNEIIIDVNGLGYQCYISINTYDDLPNVGDETYLDTYFHVSENSQLLFGFSNLVEKELFMMLISVSGIGPKTGIALLSAVTADEFKRRLVLGEVSMLTALPGIGPKTARRIIVELKDKFVKLSTNDLPIEDEKVSPMINDSYDALLALGYHINDIKKVVLKITEKNKTLTTEQIIKEALLELR